MRRIAVLLATLAVALTGGLASMAVVAPPAQAINYGWCKDTLYGNVGASQPSYVKDKDIAYVRTAIENSLDVNIVDTSIIRQELVWGDYGSADGAIRNTVAFQRGNGTGYTAVFWCEKNGIYTDWPVGNSKWGVYYG